VNDAAPSLGLSEDEAYDIPAWGKPAMLLSALALVGTMLMAVILGTAMVIGDAHTLRSWDFWGNTDVLGGLLLVSAILLGAGLVVLIKRNDNSLALLLLGVVVFESAMLWGLFQLDRPGSPNNMLLVMLVPLLAVFGLQTDGVRRWFFVSPPGLG
jgi:hypothetical protein